MSVPRAATYTRARGLIGRFLVDAATVSRPTPGAEPAPGYDPTTSLEPLGTIPCRFPAPIAGSILGAETRGDVAAIQRRYGMVVAQDEDIREGDVIGPVVDLTGRQLNVQGMRVDAVVLRSTHALVIMEEYTAQ